MQILNGFQNIIINYRYYQVFHAKIREQLLLYIYIISDNNYEILSIKLIPTVILYLC